MCIISNDILKSVIAFVFCGGEVNCKQKPFHRLFGRLVVSEILTLRYSPTANPFELPNRQKEKRARITSIRVLFLAER